MQKIKREPFYWFLPIFSIISAGVIEFCKAYYSALEHHEGLKIICEGIIAALYFLAGLLWNCKIMNVGKRKFWFRKFFAAVIFLLPPIATCVAVIEEKTQAVSKYAWMPASLLTLLFLIIILFAWLLRTENDQVT